MIIDIHTHTLCPGVNDLLGGPPDPELIPYQRDMSSESKAVDAAQGPDLMRNFNDIDSRLAAMAEMEIDFQIVSPAPGQQHYWAEADLLASVSALQNDHVAALVAKSPTQFAGLGTLPLSAPDAAVAEAARAFEELGLHGFQIDSRAGAMELSDPALDPVWRKLAQLGAALVIHPLGFSHGQRFGDFFMVNTVGQPLEEIVAANHLIFGGILDRHPELKVMIAHGGGYFPFYLGRLDHAWKARPELRRLTSQPPSEYLRRMWYDTCVFDTDTLSRLVDMAGPDRVMLGSDWPFDMGDTNPVGLVRDTVSDASALDHIMSGTAKSFFGIAP